MYRKLTELPKNQYDVLIIGGGIYGAATAWEAVSRGLSVALVEKADFGSATSANSLKVIHGGLRYLQHADLKRTRESICERKILMRIAPHLIHPLPVLVPTYGYGMKGKLAFSVGLALYDLIGYDRNQSSDPQKHIPRGYTVSKEECLKLVSGLPQQGLTGGAVFYDAQVYNSERLILCFLQSAANTGAHLANYVEVVGFLTEQTSVTGVQAKDTLTGEHFSIKAKMVINTSGPWINSVLGLLNKSAPKPARFAKAINLVTRPLFDTPYAVGISGSTQYQDADALIKRGSRFFFVAPWRNKSLVGTEYIVYEGDPNALKITEEETVNFVKEFNQAYPAAKLKLEDISFVHGGLVPMSNYDKTTGSIQLAKHYTIQDHRQLELKGLISVKGVKYTTARDVAQKVVDRVFNARGEKPPASISAVTPLHGGQIDYFESFLDTEVKKTPNLDAEVVQNLVYNYGSAYKDVLSYLDTNGTIRGRLAVLEAETRYAVRETMAQTLSDVIFRRTDLGSAGHPEDAALNVCVNTMQTELGWSDAKTEQELQEVKEKFRVGYCYDNNTTRLGSPAVQQIRTKAA